MRLTTRLRRILVLFAAILAPSICPAPLPAQFGDTEVSGPGSNQRLRVSRTELLFEKIPGVTYALYQSTEAMQGFEAFVDGLIIDDPNTAVWPVQPALILPDDLVFLLVTANDGTEDNHGGLGSEGTDRTLNVPARCGNGGAPITSDVDFQLTRWMNINTPMFLFSAPGNTDQIFILERAGRVRRWDRNDGILHDMLDISGDVITGSERGLLGGAFHPNFPNDPRLFLHFSVSASDCGQGGADHCGRVAAFEVQGDWTVTPGYDILFDQPQPFGNHDGGWIGFGPDGYLYVAFGDGGAGGDPLGSGQDTTTLLGAMLRISVNPLGPNIGPPDCATGGVPDTWGVPLDNPLADGGGGNCDEIWSWGLRNHWRNSFDRATGDLYIADVGQNQWEEIDVALASDGAGRGVNYGWNTMEASSCFNPPSGCDQTGLKLPAYEYDHSEGCSVTGGYVYRGCRMQNLAATGTYFFGEYCSGWIRTFQIDGSGNAINVQEPFADGSVSNLASFGEDADGELYVISLTGGVFRLEPIIP